MPEHSERRASREQRGRNRQWWWARIAGSIIVGFQLTAAPSSQAGDWTTSPYLQAASGHESALLLDPSGAALVVPGGAFVDLGGALSLQSRPGEPSFLQFGTQAKLERFFNELDRTLYAQTLWGDLLRRLGSSNRLRVSLDGLYFNDTGENSLRRWEAGGELGLAHLRRRWSVEAFLGGREVSYPRAETIDELGRPLDYRETRWSAGLDARLSPLSAWQLRATALVRRTEAVLDPFDSDAIQGELGIRWRPSRSWRLEGFFIAQVRNFDARDPGFDEDRYRQWGLGVSYRLRPDLELRARWAAGRYIDTAGEEEPTDRFELSLDLGPAVFGTDSGPFPTPDPTGFPERTAGEDPRGIRFQLEAPGAQRVSVVGDFNGWNPRAHPLERGADERWEIWIPLDPGRYQYLYLVDGAPVIPPESRTTVDDGFGGRNGWIEILASTP